MSKKVSRLYYTHSYAADEQWLTEKQTAERTGMSVSTLQKHRHCGKGMVYVKVGRSVRYALSDILKFMAEHQITPRTAN